MLKRLLSVLLVCALLLGIAAVGTVSASAGVTPDQVTGLWVGAYDGHQNSTIIRRGLQLEITDCFDDGKIQGFAEIDSGEKGRYYFIGYIELSSGNISLSGSEWLNNPNNFGFAEFNGTLTGDNQISGSVDNDENKSFSLQKISNDVQSMRVDLNKIYRDYSGEYDGHHNSIVVRRDYEIHITEIEEDGDITGKAIISPSEKASASHGANGSYYFKGHINADNGCITLQGNEWIDYPIQYDNFSFAFLQGYINTAERTITGFSENGIWDMKAINYDQTEKRSGFTLGKNNNNFVHTSNKSRGGAGFVDQRDYSLSDSFFNRLSAHSSNEEKSNLKEKMDEKWEGSCYGIAMSMGLLYEKYIKVEDLTKSNTALNYHTMPYPCEDSHLMNMINYYQLSQYLENGGKASAVANVYNRNFFEKLLNWNLNDDSLSVFLKSLVNYASTDHIQLLGFSTGKSGHAILVTGCRFDKFTDQYILEMYDENCVDHDIDPGEFSEMTISKDFSSFSYTDANGNKLNNSTYRRMYFLDWRALSNVVVTESKPASNHTKLDFAPGADITVTDDNDNYISVKNGVFEGDMAVYNIETAETDNGTHYIIETDDISSFTLSDMSEKTEFSVYGSDGYISVAGEHIESAELTLGESITFQGDSYTFDACISTDEIADSEDGLISVSADAEDDVSISCDANDVTVTSPEEMTNVQCKNYSGSYVELTKPGSGSDISATAEKVTFSHILGDADNDNVVSVTDASKIQYYLVGAIKKNNLYAEAADVDGDDNITVIDVTMIQRQQAEISTPVDIGGYI